MPKLSVKLPRKLVVAVSGGPDSMAGLSFLMKSPGRVVGVCHYHHGTGAFADESLSLVEDYCSVNGINSFIHQRIQVRNVPKGVSKEAFWRDCRYAFFEEVTALHRCPIVTCHTLDDCVEEYVMNKMVRFGHREVIASAGPANTIRPFLLWKKKDMLDHCRRHHVPFVQDPANEDPSYLRARIRKDVVPLLLDINPGLYRQVARIVSGDVVE